MAKRRSDTKLVTALVIAVLLIVCGIGAKFMFGGSEEPFEKTGLKETVPDGEMYVHFIDVGQGDCTLITCGETAILIDSGEVAESQTVINYLNNKGVKDIDCCIATHPHSDHIGSMGKVLNAFPVKDVIMPEIPESIIPTTKAYEKFLTAVSENAENVYPAQVGESYTYGDINIQILAPVNDYDDLNNMSVVAKVTYGKTSFMMTGDAGKPSEADMLKNNYDYSADVLKLGHHGSKTASSEAWLKAVNPDCAVICCGLNNDYGHPHKPTINRLDKLGIKYFRTDVLGDIVFVSDGTTVKRVEKN